MKIFIGMPVYHGGQGQEYEGLDGPVAVSLATGRAVIRKVTGHDPVFCRMNEGIIDRARAELVGLFLATDCTHLFFWDSDVAIPTDGVRALLEAAARRGAVSIPQRRRGGAPGDFSVREVDRATCMARFCGFGATIVARGPFENVQHGYPTLVCKSQITGKPICAMFMPMILNGEMLSEEYAFLERARISVRLLVDEEVSHAGLRGRYAAGIE